MKRSSARYMAAKRRRAKEAGLCFTCGKLRPETGYVVCSSCTKSAAQRVKRRRERERESVNLRQVLIAYERSGDVTRTHHLHADAAQCFQDALGVPGLTSDDEVRISEKLAYALSLSNNPNAAGPLFDWVAASYLKQPAKIAKAVEIFIWHARQLSLDCETESALTLLEQALELAEVHRMPILKKRIQIRIADHLVALRRFAEARLLIEATGNTGDLEDTAIIGSYHDIKARLAAINGDADEAFCNFEQAIEAHKEGTELFSIVSTWHHYARYAMMLGSVGVAKSCCERALFVARGFRIIWYIPFLCLEYANLLFRIGEYGRAHEYLRDACCYDSRSAIVDEGFAEFGIPIALHLKDDTLLAKCVRLQAIDFAFRSREPDQIGPLVAAFSQWYMVYGRAQEAQALLHRASSSITNLLQIWDFPIAVSRFGLSADLPKARALITARTNLPNAGIARACLQLFDAFWAQREMQQNMIRDAEGAASSFEALGWHGYADLARSLITRGESEQVRASAGTNRPFADMMSVLSIRERQVAELVLKGLANRAIAAELSISENTVETHMSSIMNRLGIKSRHQLATIRG